MFLQNNWHSFRDVVDFNSEKFIGTYAKNQDRLTYVDDRGDKIVVNDVERKLRKGVLQKQKYDSVCLVGYG
ncbi:hypothetical protein TELCIR_03931 [Teladorsagia circumcincta]|uniref:Uncharacterized protein n=1 Tax=Teladorsagia circumcincta TaxID=45464 RepID=A0A2G9UWG9_TELCI|nr:hypothetical protein TELCIR_03931 [Teladorsagia circumcincta]